MSDIVVAADETAATILLHHAETNLGNLVRSGTGNLGPFSTNWTANGFFANGTVDLIPPNVIRIDRCELHFNLHLAIKLDLNTILPPIHITFPSFTIKIGPFKITISIPPIWIPWPTVTVPVGHSDVATFTSDFTLHTYLAGPNWHVDAVIVGIPSLSFGIGTAALLAAIGLAVSSVLAPVPFIGPFLAGAVVVIMASIGIAGVTGLLGPILSQFVTGLTFPLYSQPRLFLAVSASSPIDPDVKIKLDELAASVVGTNEDELVIRGWFSAP